MGIPHSIFPCERPGKTRHHNQQTSTNQVTNQPIKEWYGNYISIKNGSPSDSMNLYWDDGITARDWWIKHWLFPALRTAQADNALVMLMLDQLVHVSDVPRHWYSDLARLGNHSAWSTHDANSAKDGRKLNFAAFRCHRDFPCHLLPFQSAAWSQRGSTP